jgi:hypothetical protein
MLGRDRWVLTGKPHTAVREALLSVTRDPRAGSVSPSGRQLQLSQEAATGSGTVAYACNPRY